MDTLLFAAVAEALAGEVTGQKVGTVSVPSPLWVEIGVGRGSLVFMLNPDSPVVFLSSRSPSASKERSHFAWVLERHLKGGRIRGVFRCAGDRVLGLVVAVRDRVGRVNPYTLVVEVMGRHSNLLLLNGEGRIVEPLKRVHPDMSRFRHLLPGSAYHPPPPLQKRDPFSLTREDFLEIGVSHADLGKALREKVSLPGYAVEEILARVGEEKGPRALLAAWEAWRVIADRIAEGRGYLDPRGRCLPFPLGEDTGEGLPVLRAVELFFEERQRRQVLEGTRRELARALRRKVKSVEKAIAKERERSLEYAGEEADRYQRWGEVILIHLNSISRGAKELEVEDPFEPGSLARIPLEEGLPPARTAQRYFERASKIRRKRKAALQRLEELGRVKDFLDSLAWGVESAESLEELRVLRQELVREGLLEKGKARDKRRKREREQPRLLPYRVFVTPRGNRCLVGRHPKGNEEVTFGVASRFDLWFHARDFPGAHVVLRASDPTPREVEMAASLAAYFSKDRNSPKVEVVYTQRRYVRRPPKAPRGFVLYSKERSVWVVPEVPEEMEEVV